MYRLHHLSIAVCVFTLLPAKVFVHGQSLKPYIGLHGGVNFSQPLVTESYDIITLINGEALEDRVYYPMFQNFGHQVGFSFFLSLNDYLALGLIPEMAHYSYAYTSSLEFFNDQGGLASEVENISNQRISYLNIPLEIQYTIRKATHSPFILGGASYGILRNAQLNVESNNTLHTSTGELEFSSATTDNYTTEFIRSKFNIFCGAGYSFDFTQFRVSLDITYWLGLHNLSNEANRFQNQTISGNTYNVPDDLTLNHLVANVSILFPINKTNSKGSLDCVPNKKRK
jgi:hypothetical protein